jgi:hypothetical protein
VKKLVTGERKPIPSGRIFSAAKPLTPPLVTYTVSARTKPVRIPVFAYLRRNYGNLSLREIDSLFGFVEPTKLYGGRMFRKPELSLRDTIQLNAAGIGVRIPLSNHFVTKAEYEETRPLLERHHKDLNSVIVTNDNLARWIRRDYPKYNIDASVIKNIKKHDAIKKAMELYDSVVLPMPLNEDLDFLEKIKDKDKITLFANAGCALTCPSRLCYVSISKINKQRGDTEFQCSQEIKDRDLLGMVDFPLEPYIKLGFHKFKLLRSRPGGMTGF